ncbi:MAG: HD domain-containing protein, partial [Chloroflexota bacterium]
PSLETAEALLLEAATVNPGFGWVEHSRNVASAAGHIARSHPDLDETTAYVFGLLHDIGRRAGYTHNRHILDGYTYLEILGYTKSARICLTHSFPVRDITYCVGQWDTTPEEYAFLRDFLQATAYDEYDRLLQLCDALALPTGFCLLEKRLVDVAMRHGINDTTVARWQALFDLKAHFDKIIGVSIYTLLPGIVSTTFETGEFNEPELKATSGKAHHLNGSSLP